MQELRAQLAQEIDEAEWDWLMPHARRDSLIVVTPDLDIVDVGVAIANDDVLCVQRWIEEALIYKPSAEQLTDWNSNQTKRFQTLIVQPFVLVKEL